MKNFIDELQQKVAQKEVERDQVQRKIEDLNEQIEKARERQKAALAAKDNAAYMDAFREIKDYETQIEGLKSLMGDMRNTGMDQREVALAWDKTKAEFEHDRRKAVAEYQKAKRALAKQFLEMHRAEKMMADIKQEAERLKDHSSNLTVMLADVSAIENNAKSTYNYFKDVFDEMGLSFFDIF